MNEFLLVVSLVVVFTSLLGGLLFYMDYVKKKYKRLNMSIYGLNSEYKFYEGTFIKIWGEGSIEKTLGKIEGMLAGFEGDFENVEALIDTVTRVWIGKVVRFDRLTEGMTTVEKLEFIKEEIDRYCHLSRIQDGVYHSEKEGRIVDLHHDLNDFERLQKSLPKWEG